MLRPIETHAEFQARLRTRLAAGGHRNLSAWADELQLVWCADLDFADPLLRSTYSAEVGRPVEHAPKDLLRCLLLCQAAHARSLSEWHRRMGQMPLLVLLSGLRRVPSIGTLYLFLNRLFPRVAARRAHGICRRHRRVPKPAPGQKMTSADHPRKLARIAAWFRRHHDAPALPRPADLWDQLLFGAVAGSTALGIIPAGPLPVAADGSLLRSGAHSHGHKTCDCPGRGCHCDRHFSDATARVGYDSTNNCFVLGRSFYALAETASGHQLPLYVLQSPANRPDAVSYLFCARQIEANAPFRISTAYADSAHDYDAVYRYSFDQSIEPVFDRRGAQPAALPAVVQRCADAGLTLSAEARPRCAHDDLLLHSCGHARPGVRQFECPLPDPSACPETSCPLHDGSRFTIDARLQPRLLARNPKTEPYTRDDYKQRTNVERTFSALTSASGLDTARHRRDYVWHGRFAISALFAHARLWVKTKTTLAPSAWLSSVWALSA